MSQPHEILLAMGRNLDPVRCAVVHPCGVEALQSALEARDSGLVDPVLVGPEDRIRALAEGAGLDLRGLDIIPAPYSHASALVAVEMAVANKVEALMKGSLHTDEMMHAALSNRDFRTRHRLSHIYRFEVPLYNKPLLITDAVLNIRPSLAEKVDIVQNVINLSEILGVFMPQVALLSAIESVNPDLPSTLDAAALCKMAERGQITGAVLDGPLAFDSAISKEAASMKHIQSDMPGNTDILIVPDLESGNMLAKQLEYLANATASGVVVGGKVPVALTGSADGLISRVGSALLAKLIAHHHRKHRP